MNVTKDIEFNQERSLHLSTTQSSHAPCEAYFSFKIELEQDTVLLFLLSQELARCQTFPQETD